MGTAKADQTVRMTRLILVLAWLKCHIAGFPTVLIDYMSRVMRKPVVFANAKAKALRSAAR